MSTAIHMHHPKPAVIALLDHREPNVAVLRVMNDGTTTTVFFDNLDALAEWLTAAQEAVEAARPPADEQVAVDHLEALEVSA